MKFFRLSAVVIFLILSVSAICHASGATDAFHNGVVYQLSGEIIPEDGDFYIAASDLETILNMKTYFDSQNSTCIITYNGALKAFALSSDTHGSDAQYHLPKYIADRIYIPLSLLNREYDFSIKFSSDNSSIYILPKGNLTKDVMSSFKNMTFNYSLSIPENVVIPLDEADPVFHDDNLMINDRSGLYSVEISCEKFTDEACELTRKYFSDYTSPEEDMFVKYAEYRLKLFDAMQDFYRTEYLYPENADASQEKNIKLFREYTENIYSQSSYVLLYNLSDSDREKSTEKTHITIIIPDRSDKTIYTLDFSLERGTLDANTSGRISALINSIFIAGLPAQMDKLSVFSDTQALNAANQGIYPPLDTIVSLDSVYDDGSCSLSLPSSFIPYRQNKIIDGYGYDSYKIDYNTMLSINFEPAVASDAIANKINVISALGSGSVTFLGDDTVSISDMNFRRLQYFSLSSGIPEYCTSYLAVSGGRLYSITLESRFKQPDEKAIEIFNTIMASIKFTPATAGTITGITGSPVKFIDAVEGYSFACPEGWQIVRGISKTPGLAAYRIKDPQYSGPVNITVNEALISTYDYTEALKLLTGTEASQFSGKLTNYTPPYVGQNSRLLSVSSYNKDGAYYISKLVNFVDENDRVKLCYVQDIVNNGKVYSIFISISDYNTSEGKIDDLKLRGMVNSIQQSFKLEPADTAVFNNFSIIKRYWELVREFIKS